MARHDSLPKSSFLYCLFLKTCFLTFIQGTRGRLAFPLQGRGGLLLGGEGEEGGRGRGENGQPHEKDLIVLDTSHFPASANETAGAIIEIAVS